MIGNSFYKRVRSPVFNFFGTFHPSSKKMTVLVLDSGGAVLKKVNGITREAISIHSAGFITSNYPFL